MNYWGFNNPPPMNSPDPHNHGNPVIGIIKRIDTLTNIILKLIQYIHSKGQANVESNGWSCGCCCCAFAASAVVIAIGVGVALGVGLGVGLQHDEASNSTSSNTTISDVIMEEDYSANRCHIMTQTYVQYAYILIFFFLSC
jgi:Na+/H+-dicarboxylate symporter